MLSEYQPVGGSVLLGRTGFVGGTLASQHLFDAEYRSTDIGSTAGCRFDLVVCAAAPGLKWKANREPEADLQAIRDLIGHLGRLQAGRFILVSTVDVFPDPEGMDESAPLAAHPQAYGRHRVLLEAFVRSRFPLHHVVRLPGLVGSGLRKNALFDLHHRRPLHDLDARDVFQFYPMDRLWADLTRVADAGLDTVHLAVEPIALGQIASGIFGSEVGVVPSRSPVRYDFRTRHAGLWGRSDGYAYGRDEVMEAIRAYARSERRSLAAPP